MDLIQFIPDFVDFFDAQNHVKFLTKMLKISTAPITSKYEGFKSIFVYMCLTGLKLFDQTDLIAKLRPEMVKFIELCFIETKSSGFFSESPILNFELYSSSLILSTFFYIGSLKILGVDISIYEEKVMLFLNEFDLDFLNLRELYSYCCLKVIFHKILKDKTISKKNPKNDENKKLNKNENQQCESKFMEKEFKKQTNLNSKSDELNYAIEHKIQSQQNMIHEKMENEKLSFTNSSNQFTEIEKTKIMSKVSQLKTFDHSFALEPFCESHSAATFLSLSILKLINNESNFSDPKTAYWLLNRQADLGFSV